MPEGNRKKGFTIIEVIVVLILIAILPIVVVSRMASSTEADNKAKAEALKGHIRYVQMRAMNTDSDKSAIPSCDASFGISLSSNSYFMFRNCDKSLKVLFPGQDTADVFLGNTTLSPSFDITFDNWGRPCSDLNGTTLFNADINLTLGSESIKITKNTGHVP